MEVEKLTRYVPDVLVDAKTGKAGALLCVEHAEGDYLDRSAVLACVAELQAEMQGLQLCSGR